MVGRTPKLRDASKQVRVCTMLAKCAVISQEATYLRSARAAGGPSGPLGRSKNTNWSNLSSTEQEMPLERVLRRR